ncbi:MAG: tetratricopeptide repeat protein [Gammaproteobacteria bacterium]|nr:tetratricopeptide repeat protein [Gammaproteobacteria bacterium]
MTAVLIAWLAGVFDAAMPTPARVWLLIKEESIVRQQRPVDKFRVVLCWLEDDRSGSDTKFFWNIVKKFDGFEPLRCGRVIKSSGTGAEWREGMRNEAQRTLTQFDADLIIFGRVELGGGEQWSLWFLRRSGEITFDYPDSDNPYLVRGTRLHEDFTSEIQEQLEAIALSLAVPLVDNEVRNTVVREGLKRTIEQLSHLLSDETIQDPERRGRLLEALGIAQMSLGARESGTHRLEEAVISLRASLEDLNRTKSPRPWAATQNNLGLAYLRLGERTSDTTILRKAVTALRIALEAADRNEPHTWGGLHLNLGIALARLAERENNKEALAEALETIRLSFNVFTREDSTRRWVEAKYSEAVTLTILTKVTGMPGPAKEALHILQSLENTADRLMPPVYLASVQYAIANALLRMSKSEPEVSRLQQAVDIYRKVLSVYTRERNPYQWSSIQNNLGIALTELGTRIGDREMVQEAVLAHGLALKERHREFDPLYWAQSQSNLGNALFRLGRLSPNLQVLERAGDAYLSALKEYSRKKTPRDWGATQSNLGDAFLLRGIQNKDRHLLVQAVSSYREALTVFTREKAPIDWADIQGNLGIALFTLGQQEQNARSMEQAIEAYRSALEVISHSDNPDDWSRIQKNLGLALLILGMSAEGQESTELLEQAGDAFKKSITEIQEYPVFQQ